MADKTIESLKQDFIQEVMSESSFDTLKEWLYMHEEARYVASLTSKEPELIESKKNSLKTIVVVIISIFSLIGCKDLMLNTKKI